MEANYFGSPGKVRLSTKSRFVLATSSIRNAGRGYDVSCGKLPHSIGRNAIVLVSSNLVSLGIGTIGGGSVVYAIISNKPVAGRGNIGIPGISLTLPCLSRGSVRSLGFNTGVNFSFVTTSFYHANTSVICLHGFYRTLN